MMRRYVIDLTAYDHVASFTVDAESDDEAIERACELKNISVTIRSSHEIDSDGIAVVSN